MLEIRSSSLAAGQVLWILGSGFAFDFSPFSNTPLTEVIVLVDRNEL